MARTAKEAAAAARPLSIAPEAAKLPAKTKPATTSTKKPAVAKAPVPRSTVCVEDGCDATKLYASGRCRRHFDAYRAAKLGPCSVTGCDSGVLAKGLCRKHYSQARAVAAEALSEDELKTLITKAKGVCSLKAYATAENKAAMIKALRALAAFAE